MKVCKLFRKEKQGSPVKPCSSLYLQKGIGIKDDVNGMVGSPRHLLIVSSSSLKEFGLAAGELRENILVDEPIENLHSGQTIRIGEEALVRLTFLCEPCAKLERLQVGLQKKIRNKRGFLGMVVRDGAIAIGDEISITPLTFPPLDNQPKNRFTEFVSRIPYGKVVRTADLIMAIGVAKAYYRAIPSWLHSASTDVPIHRLIRADGGLLSQHIPNQAQRLAAEGVEIYSDRISEQYYWQPQNFYRLD